ncbi:putative holin-like toxin [Sporosarcina beigongshangi]|nr:putative holin-like toxin [Sporosarcina beigongshangi]
MTIFQAIVLMISFSSLIVAVIGLADKISQKK